MSKNIFVAAIMLFSIAVVNDTPQAAGDPVELISSAKTPVHLHSLAPGDNLVHYSESWIGTQWQSIYPHNTYDHRWSCTGEIGDNIPGLNPPDRLKIVHDPTGNSVWTRVEEVTISLVLSSLSTPDHIIHVEFVDGWTEVGSLFVAMAILPPVAGSMVEELWPICWRYAIVTWYDNGEPFGQLSTYDAIELFVQKSELPPGQVISGDSATMLDYGPTTWWRVEDVAINIQVFSIPDPTVPTMTQWGIIILVALILGSAVFVMLRRRKATVAA